MSCVGKGYEALLSYLCSQTTIESIFAALTEFSTRLIFVFDPIPSSIPPPFLHTSSSPVAERESQPAMREVSRIIPWIDVPDCPGSGCQCGRVRLGHISE